MSCDGMNDSRLAEGERTACASEIETSSILTTPPNFYQTSDIRGGQPVTQPSEVLNNILAKITELQVQFSAIQVIQSDMSQVKTDLAEMRNSLNTKVEEMAVRIDSIESRVDALESCRAELTEVKNMVHHIMADQRNNDQWVRRSNIQLNGIPETRGENLQVILKSLADLSGYPLNTSSDIDFVTRVAVKNDKDNNNPKPIIVKFLARYKKDDFLSSLRKLKNLKASDLGFSNNENRIFINDHLSTFNKYLLKQAQIKKTQKGYKYCWVRNCTVMVRKSDSSPILYITSEEALNKIT
ncbi:uncharacterized protein LOC134667475 [Cydia fagiglandana]|uniref:uncharacterized protein LOC134667475 n=1 Tax=Cydia fagiglandana TaxID=1458189 RepID=UPI002FEDE791